MARYSRKTLAQMILSQSDETKRKNAIKAVANYLVSSGRTKELEVLIREIELVAQEDHSLVSAKIKSANQLNDHQLDQIKRTVRDFTNKVSIELQTSVDPSLLGGVVINTPESEADLSVKGRLSRMRN